MAKRGASAQRLKALRKKFGLGEFAKSRTGKRSKRIASAGPKQGKRKGPSGGRKGVFDPVAVRADKREGAQRIRSTPKLAVGSLKIGLG